MARAGDVKSVEPFVTDVNQDDSEMVRAAMTFALYKKGHPNYLGRLIDFMDSDRLMPQIYGYLVELGPSIVAPAVVRLKEPDDDVRRNLVTILGVLGDQSTVIVLTPYKEDRSREVATAASNAIERINERIKMTAR